MPVTETILEIEVANSDGALEWLESAEGVHDSYLSGAVIHAVAGEAEAAAMQRRLREAGFSDASVQRIDPSIEDVFVHLVAREREGAGS